MDFCEADFHGLPWRIAGEAVAVGNDYAAEIEESFDFIDGWAELTPIGVAGDESFSRNVRQGERPLAVTACVGLIEKNVTPRLLRSILMFHILIAVTSVSSKSFHLRETKPVIHGNARSVPARCQNVAKCLLGNISPLLGHKCPLATGG